MGLAGELTTATLLIRVIPKYTLSICSYFRMQYTLEYVFLYPQASAVLAPHQGNLSLQQIEITTENPN